MVLLAPSVLWRNSRCCGVEGARRAYPPGNRLCLPRATRVIGWALIASAGSLGSNRALAAEVFESGSSALVTAPEQPDFTFDLRLLAGGAALALTQSLDSDPYGERHVGDAAAATFGVGLQWGWFADRHIQLGFAHSIMRYEWLGNNDVTSVSAYEQDYWTDESAYTVYSPLGVFVEIQPGLDTRAFLNLSASLGYIPSVEGQGGTVLMAGVAIEVGHELGSVTKAGLGVFLRYAAWTGTEDFFYTDFPAGLTSHELTLGARFSFEFPTATGEPSVSSRQGEPNAELPERALMVTPFVQALGTFNPL